MPNSKVYDSSTRMPCPLILGNTEISSDVEIQTQVKCALVTWDIFHRKCFCSIFKAWHSLDILFPSHFHWFIWCWLRSSISTEWNQDWEVTRTKGRDILKKMGYIWAKLSRGEHVFTLAQGSICIFSLFSHYDLSLSELILMRHLFKFFYILVGRNLVIKQPCPGNIHYL